MYLFNNKFLLKHYYNSYNDIMKISFLIKIELKKSHCMKFNPEALFLFENWALNDIFEMKLLLFSYWFINLVYLKRL